MSNRCRKQPIKWPIYLGQFCWLTHPNYFGRWNVYSGPLHIGLHLNQYFCRTRERFHVLVFSDPPCMAHEICFIRYVAGWYSYGQEEECILYFVFFFFCFVVWISHVKDVHLLWTCISMAVTEQNIICNCMSSCEHNNMHFSECSLPSWRMLQDVSSIYLWSRTSAFSAIEPSAAVSQGKLTSLLIALLVITECSWSSAVSSLGDILSLRLSFLPTARSSNALQRISLGLYTDRGRYLQTTGGPGGQRHGAVTRSHKFMSCSDRWIWHLIVKRILSKFFKMLHKVNANHVRFRLLVWSD